jgi:cellulose synthase/poly-beta-1,6-N-acetylglucosamine synthase-like glycosyltransferase
LRPAAAIVIPARDAAALLPVCLASITPQLRPGDEVIVVDDASSDATVEIAELYGATVLTSATPAGPYQARNRGWRSTQAELIVFTDSRCRARADWLESMRAPFVDDSVALVGADIETILRPTLAGRVQHHRQSLHSRHYTSALHFLPWFPTANLAVRRAALAAVGGLRPVRSGGDAEICWRIQLAGLGRMKLIQRPLMDWVPRAGVREFLRQWSRYGTGHAELYRTYRAAGMPRRDVSVARRTRRVVRVLASDLLKHRQRPDVALLDATATWVHQRALRRALSSVTDSASTQRPMPAAGGDVAASRRRS